MKCLDTVDLSTFFIRISRECVYESVYLSYFWHIIDMEIPFIRRRSDEYGSILEEKTPHTMLAHRTISDIAIAHVHREL
jgi:hypothetical protein